MKSMIVIGILLVALTGVAMAQTPIFSGPVGYNIVVTEEQEVSVDVRKLVNFTTRFNGTITVDLDSGDSFPHVTMEGTVSDGTSITIDCSSENMGGASAEGDNTKKAVNDKWFLVACCSFTASSNDPEEPPTEGIAFLNLSGTMKRPKGWTYDYPESIKITGSKINGGTNGFVFKGTFSSTLTPQ
jgi:hypothetical protein